MTVAEDVYVCVMDSKSMIGISSLLDSATSERKEKIKRRNPRGGGEVFQNAELVG